MVVAGSFLCVSLVPESIHLQVQSAREPGAEPACIVPLFTRGSGLSAHATAGEVKSQRIRSCCVLKAKGMLAGEARFVFFDRTLSTPLVK
jgi:hypothetical protein